MKYKLTALIAVCTMIIGSISAYAAVPELKVIEENQSSITILDITPIDDASDLEQSVLSTDSHYPVEIKVLPQDSSQLLIKTYIVPQSVTAENLIEEELFRQGNGYRMLDILHRNLEDVVTSKPISQKISTTSETDDKQQLIALFAPTIQYNQDDFIATLTLDENSIQAEVLDTKNYSYTVKDTKEFLGLDRNDPYYIPKTTVKNGVTLSLTNVDWIPMASGANNSSVPSAFRAVATYTGTAWGSTPSSYTVTANYVGEATKTVLGDAVYSIVYEEITPEESTSVLDTNTLTYLLLATLLITALCGAGFYLGNKRARKAQYAQDINTIKRYKKEAQNEQ